MPPPSAPGAQGVSPTQDPSKTASWTPGATGQLPAEIGQRIGQGPSTNPNQPRLLDPSAWTRVVGGRIRDATPKQDAMVAKFMEKLVQYASPELKEAIKEARSHLAENRADQAQRGGGLNQINPNSQPTVGSGSHDQTMIKLGNMAGSVQPQMKLPEVLTKVGIILFGDLKDLLPKTAGNAPAVPQGGAVPALAKITNALTMLAFLLK